MPNRTELITRFPLVESGQRMPKDALQAKEAELLKSLRDDVPVLNHLRASRLATDYEVVDKGLKLVVLLQEAAQVPLPFPAAGTGRRAGTLDPFLEDLADVKRQASEAEGRIMIATSGASSPLDGSADGPHASSTTTIRRRVRRGIAAGGVFVPDGPDARPLIIEQPSPTLPQGARIVITARICALFPDSAQLASVRLTDARDSGLSFRFSATKQLTLARVGPFLKVEAGTRLQTAMDSKVRLRLEVLAALDWATGKVVSFELRDILER